jgi:2-methylcitrate dehydratase PrpD
MSAGKNIAKYIRENNFDSFPSDVVEKAKLCILDNIGVALYGTKFEAAQILRTFATESGGREEATVLGSRVKVPAALAAFANGVAAHVADYDDNSFMMLAHPSCTLVPTALALCEMMETTGRSMLEAFLIGIEVGGKLGKVMTWSHYEAGWHGTATIGTMAAAVVAAKILNLSEEQVTHTLAIAASSAGGLRENFGTMTKSFHAGQAARNGIYAAQLAKKGYTASSDIFEAPSGFFNTFTGAGDPTTIEKELGEPYTLESTFFKRYPSCAATHQAVDAILDLKDSVDFDPEEVEEIECRVRPVNISELIHPDPQNELEAKFSMQFCISACLVAGKLGISEFDSKTIHSPQVQKAMKKIKMVGDDDLEKLALEKNLLAPTELKLTLTNGKQYTKKVIEAKGGPADPLQNHEVEAKFLECASVLLPLDQSKEALEMLRRIETIKKISDLVEAISL